MTANSNIKTKKIRGLKPVLVVLASAGLCPAAFAQATSQVPGQVSGQIAGAVTGQVSVQTSGRPTAFVPTRPTMPKAFVPPPAMSSLPQFRPAVVPRSGMGLTRPLPLNFGGTRAKLPGPIGSFRLPPGSTNPVILPTGQQLQAGTFAGQTIVVPTGGGDGFTQVVTGPTPTQSLSPRGDGFFGHIGTSGATLGFSSSSAGSGSGSNSQSNFSFETSINNSSNVAVANTGIWLTPGLHSLSGQWNCYRPYGGYGGYYGYGYGSGYGYGYPIYSPSWPYTDPALSTYYVPPTPAQPAPQAGQTGPTVLEQAEMLLGYERFTEAAGAYREHLAQHPDDAEALRMLGVTLLLDRKPREAGESMLSAYRMNPALAGSPIVLPQGLGPSDLANATNRAIEYARRTKSAPAWLTAAVLTQARDKMPVARTFAKNAKAMGLDPEVFARLMSAWSS